jgi:hypothetical protein
MGIKQVVDILAIANNDLPAIEERVKTLRNDMNTLQFQKHALERNLYQLNNKIASTTKLLNSLCMSCGRERREIENLYNEKTRLKAIVTGIKNNNQEYHKIKQTVEDNVKSVLTDSKLLLEFATLSVIESLRSNPELYNFVIYDNSNNTTPISYGSNYPSLMSSGRQQHQQQLFNDSYTALILEEAEKLYNKLITEFTNMAIVAAAAMTASSLSSPSISNKQKIIHKSDNTYDEP